MLQKEVRSSAPVLRMPEATPPIGKRHRAYGCYKIFATGLAILDATDWLGDLLARYPKH